MPRFIVRIRKTELVVLNADVRVNAPSAIAALSKLNRHLDRGGEVDDRLWYECEADSSETDEPIRIEGVWLERHH